MTDIYSMKSDNYDEILLIYECGSFSKAADKLGITQPALSFRVKKIEEEIGGKIFNRTADNSLTSEGQAYIEYIRQKKLLEQNFKKKLTDMRNLIEGKLIIGATQAFASGYLLTYITEFIKKYPNVDITIMDGRISEIAQAAKGGKVDLFLTGVEDEDKDLEKQLLFSEEVFLCIPPKYKRDENLVDKFITRDMLKDSGIGKSTELPKVDMRYFKDDTFILLPETFNMGKISCDMLKQVGLYDVVRRMYINQMTTGNAYTQCGLGVSFVSEDYIRFANLSEFPLVVKCDVKEIFQNVYVSYSKNHYLTSTANTFLGMLLRDL